jgi:hypothetical protein
MEAAFSSGIGVHSLQFAGSSVERNVINPHAKIKPRSRGAGRLDPRRRPPTDRKLSPHNLKAVLRIPAL